MTAIETKQSTLTGRIEVSSGFIHVYTSAVDCEGTCRSISFPRLGRILYGQPLYHWTVKPLVRQAMVIAKKHLKQNAK